MGANMSGATGRTSRKRQELWRMRDELVVHGSDRLKMAEPMETVAVLHMFCTRGNGPENFSTDSVVVLLHNSRKRDPYKPEK